MEADHETGAECPKCGGIGRLVERSPATVRSTACELCGGTGSVSLATLYEWKAAHPTRRPPAP